MTTTKKKKRIVKRVNNDLALRYEDAWNYVVSHSPAWKQDVVINMTEEEAKAKRGRTADAHGEVAKDVMFLAESNRKIPPPKENWRKPE